MANIDLEKKKNELKERFDKVKAEALKEEQIISSHQKIHKIKVEEMSDLQAQYRLLEELQGKGKIKKNGSNSIHG